MRLTIPSLLAQIAAIVAATPGCSSSNGGCGAPPPPKTLEVSGDEACQLAQSIVATHTPVGGPVTENPIGLCTPGGWVAESTSECMALCAGYNECSLADDYATQLSALQPWCSDAATSDASGTASGGAGDGGVVCPTVMGTVSVACSFVCVGGRWTRGIARREETGLRSLGEHFARSSYFEAASVIAFDRLARELVAHGAPASLVRAARRAQKDEVRHARSMRRLAARFGVRARWPEAKPLPVRALAEVARENAAEGCVRETYGAVVGLLAASRAPDPEVRLAMQSIARDECRHAQLSWRVAAWAARKLGERDLASVQLAMRKSVAELVASGDQELSAAHRAIIGLPSPEERRRAVGLLEGALFRAA